MLIVIQRNVIVIMFSLILTSAVHSFILDVDDEIIRRHFNNADLQEIADTPWPIIPELSDEVAGYLSKFSGLTRLTDIREMLNSHDDRFGRNYNRYSHHDLDYIRFAIHAM
jgi:hypothetical protein